MASTIARSENSSPDATNREEDDIVPLSFSEQTNFGPGSLGFNVDGQNSNSGEGAIAFHEEAQTRCINFVDMQVLPTNCVGMCILQE